MKNLTLTLALGIMMSLIACDGPNADLDEQATQPLTSEEVDNIKSEVAQKVDEIQNAANELNTDVFREIYWNDPGFMVVHLNKIQGYEDYMQESEEMYEGLESMSFNKTDLKINVLDQNTAIAIFEGDAKMTTKQGDNMNISDFYASMLFRKVDGDWKVAYSHESAVFEQAGSDSTFVNDTGETRDSTYQAE